MNTYTKEYLKNTIDIILDQIEDLERWNAYNDDEYSSEVASLKTILEVLKAKIEN